MDAELYELSGRVGDALKARKLMMAAAESCTGGWIGQAVTMVPGSSKWFDRGFVTYTNLAKKQMLGVTQRSLGNYGAVSEDVAAEMARGAIRHSAADVSVAITGIAGPTGGSRSKPVGLVWFAWAVRGGAVQTRCFRFKGNRTEIRLQSVAVALQGLIDLLRKPR